MKIIKQPDVSNWSHQHACLHCTSVLEIEASDLIYHHYNGDQREPSYDAFISCCPVCKNNFNVPTNVIPKLLQIKLKNK